MPATLSPPAPALAPAATNRVPARLHQWRKAKSTLAAGISFVCALVVVAPLALVLGYLFIKGASSLNLAFFTNLPSSPGEIGGGVANAIVGTFVLITIASAIGVPIGVLGALYLTEYGGRRFNAVIRTSADILNGVPSIVWASWRMRSSSIITSPSSATSFGRRDFPPRQAASRWRSL